MAKYNDKKLMIVMLRQLLLFMTLFAFQLANSSLHAADTVPVEVQMPGTQPGEAALESVTRCDNCHQADSPEVTIAHDWRGSMMSHAGRDPIFWATVAIAEQDFDGSGDLCIRCHTMAAWLDGRSTPTDGSALTIADAVPKHKWDESKFHRDVDFCGSCHDVSNPVVGDLAPNNGA
ncbi:MAG: hypothetical protein IMF17_07165, partial [Proteobacteria bacterium]|nr:hypothetical protein [Pseudomonadota bacterium]